MTLTWCFRCKKEVPMVDEAEWQALWTRNDEDRVWEEFQRLTGETRSVSNRKLMLSHRRSQYGHPCPNCGRLFRTPNAQFCAECGYRPAPQR